MRLVTSVFFMTIILGVTSTTNAGPRVQRIGYSIEIPDGWIEIPREVLNEYEDILAQESPNTPKEHYEFGFQPESSENWLTHPFVLIQYRLDRRIHESELANFSTKNVRDAIENEGSTNPNTLQANHLQNIYYHKHTNKIWLEIKAPNPELGLICILQGTTPTETGCISVIGASLINDVEEYQPIFRKTALSVIPNPEIAYKANWSAQHENRISLLAKGLVKLFVFISILSIAFVRHRNKKKPIEA